MARATACVPGGNLRQGTGEERSVPTFDHHRLDAFSVARQALEAGDAIARRIPRGYATLADQLRRALLAAFLGIAEASSRSGADRLARFRCARGEASEAAAALEAVQLLHLAPDPDIGVVLSRSTGCARCLRASPDSVTDAACHASREPGTLTLATLEHEHGHGLAHALASPLTVRKM